MRHLIEALNFNVLDKAAGYIGVFEIVPGTGGDPASICTLIHLTRLSHLRFISSYQCCSSQWNLFSNQSYWRRVCLSENRTYLLFIHFLLVHVSVAVKTAPTCTTNTMITTVAFGRFWHKSNLIGLSAPQIINLALLFLKILRNFPHNYLFSAVSRKIMTTK